MTARPFENAEALFAIVLGTTRSPGKVTITGHDRPKNWQNEKAKGTTGSSSTLNGDDITPFQCSFYLAGDGTGTDFEQSNDFDNWEKFQKLIESTTNGTKPIALPIFHPALARQRITEVVNAGVGGMTYDDMGGCTVVVKFQEYKPPKPKKPAKPTAGKTRGGSRGGNSSILAEDPNAAAKRQLAALVEEAKRP